MGSNTSYHQYGKEYQNTLSTSDIVSLKKLKFKPKKISHIRVFIKDYIVGFECFYDGISAGARTGFYTQSSEIVDFALGPDEWLTKVSGTSYEIIDTLTFHTSFGRRQTVGTYRNGKYFEFSGERKIIQYFKVGFGRYMHTIGVFMAIKPINRPRNRVINRSLTVQHQNRPLTARTYYQPPPLMTQPPVQPPIQRPFQAPSPRYHQPPPVLSHPPLASTMPYTPSINSTSYQPPPAPITARPCTPTSPDSSLARPVAIPVPSKSDMAGVLYDNTISFDDYEKHVKQLQGARLKELRVVHDDNCIYGLQAVYQADGNTVFGDIHCHNRLPTGVRNQAIMLGYNEVVTEISGKYIDIINGLKIKTSYGHTYSFGRVNVDTPHCKTFRIETPTGKKLLAISGGGNSYLHNLILYHV